MKCTFDYSTDNSEYTWLNFHTTSFQERLNKNYFIYSGEDSKLPFVTEMVENHRKCPYWTLLKHFCPCALDISLSAKESCCASKNGAKKNMNLSDDFLPVQSIFLFIRCIFLKVVPKSALGNKRNFNTFLKHVQTFLSIQLKGTMSLHYLCANIKVKVIPWIQAEEHRKRRTLLSSAVDFFMMKVIFPLVQSFFYVTESTTHKKRLFFFRKKTWHRLHQQSCAHFIKQCGLKLVPQAWVQEKRQKGLCLGVCTVRFLLKKPSLRPIVNMSQKSHDVSINKHLKALLLALRWLKDQHPVMLGASILSIDDIHCRWKAFTDYVKSKSIKQLYFVKIDIEKCFDTINPCLLYSVVQNQLLSQEKYHIYHYKRNIQSDGQSKVVYYQSSDKPEIECRTRQGAQFVHSFSVSSEVLLKKLQALLFANVIRLGRQHYVQSMGIPQGSSISSILCSFYYGYMDQVKLYEFQRKPNFLVRMIDDMLFVSPSRKRAEAFFTMMIEGVPEFNCKSSLRKCCATFDYSHPEFGRAHTLKPSEPLTFCGLAIDCRSLNILVDFSNNKNITVRDTVSLCLANHPGLQLKKLLSWYLRPKSYAVLFDKDINTETSIITNVLHIFMLVAVKFHSHIKQLPPKQRIESNPNFFLKLIQEMPHMFMKIVVQKLQKSQSSDQGMVSFPLSTLIVKRLCTRAFLYKLRMHDSMYKLLIKQLQVQERQRHKGQDLTIVDLSEVYRAVCL
ncbi:telomerase reverse transcriptase [Aplysia californica]|uniref:Telomerase reverse transcriptase n=1 Tax=Aplysia californica TaxID=6500 RepID=A0ABM0JK04_APLCA|nr:telomerase reverse transcriptase [Aplysia californica]